MASTIEHLFHDLVVVAAIDGVIDEKEKDLLIFYGDALGIDKKTIDQVIFEVLENKDTVFLYDGPKEEKEYFLGTIKDMMEADGVIDPKEQQLYDRLKNC